MSEKSAVPAVTSSMSFWSAPRPAIFRPLFPSSAYVLTIEYPRESAYRPIASDWFMVEYCWCSVDMRTYSAARVTPPGVPDNLSDGVSNLPSTNHGGSDNAERQLPGHIRPILIYRRYRCAMPKGCSFQAPHSRENAQRHQIQ